jgi:hypothetical protein
MGIHKEVRKLFGSSVLNYMISARTAQGYEDAKTATPLERQDILNRWIEHKSEYQNSKQKFQESGLPEGHESGRLTPTGFLQTRHLSFEERKKLHVDRKKYREEERIRIHGENHRCPFCRRTEPHTHTPRRVQTTPSVVHSVSETDQFEQAIHASVAATSRGNAEEDMIIERAIRASVRELVSSQGASLSDQEAVNRAIQASIAEAGRRHSSESSTITMTDEEAEHQAALEKAIQKSLAEYQLSAAEAVDEEVDSDEDENVKLAIQMSKEETAALANEEETIRLALQKSKDEAESARTEEDIVLEYAKKQSLLEEQHRQAIAGKQREEPEPHSAADEEALNKAIEESLKAHGGAGATGSGSGA